ncbi:VOC family protein [Kitasatospora sp. NPDC059599]|uniref:VOC family protein n=1 Tax=Kitasatospora sp. NPDC059599 TaxID=3346880 RepID=UPI0036811ACA
MRAAQAHTHQRAPGARAGDTCRITADLPPSDVDGPASQAVAAGAELLAPPADMPYGARQSVLRDPFGHVRIFLTPLA